MFHDRAFRIAGTLPVHELTGTDGEPSPVPRLESTGRSFKEIAFHADPVLGLALQHRHNIFGSDNTMTVFHGLLQANSFLPQPG